MAYCALHIELAFLLFFSCRIEENKLDLLDKTGQLDDNYAVLRLFYARTLALYIDLIVLKECLKSITVVSKGNGQTICFRIFQLYLCSGLGSTRVALLLKDGKVRRLKNIDDFCFVVDT